MFVVFDYNLRRLGILAVFNWFYCDLLWFDGLFRFACTLGRLVYLRYTSGILW